MNDKTAYIASVVAVYWFVSISMVYLNKVLMSNETLSIPAPLFLTWFQCIVTSLVCYIAGVCGQRVNSYQALPTDEGSKVSFFSQFPKAEYRSDTALRIFPLSVIFVLMISFNNLCLKWVEVSFYNVARSMTIVFNVFFTRVLLDVRTSTNTMLCLVVVIVGFFVGAHGEIHFSFFGTVAGVVSSIFVSLNSIFTKRVLPAVDDNHWRLTFYNNMNAGILFIPLVVYFEGGIILKAMNHQLTTPIFWSAMVVAGIFGFLIGIVTVLQIKATSPLSHNISGTAKAAVQSLMAFYIWGNPATFMGVLGIFLVLGGSLLYTVVKMREASSPRPVVQTSQEMTSKGETA